nr:hypothetical protein [Bacteroidota bacterium]
DIYAQIYLNDSIPFGENFKVSNDGGTASQYGPQLAVDPNLNFVITWADKRNGEWNIYAQRFSNNGTALGENFKVNEEPGNEEQAHPSIAIDSCGNFVIVWADEKSGDFDIWGQRYASDGTALGENFKINDDTGTEFQYWPNCSCDKNGNFIVSWVDKRYYDDYEIYAQRFLADGLPIGNNFLVNDDAGYFMQLRPDICIEENGNFIIVWEDERNGEWDIYAQRYLDDGTTLGDNFKINDNTPDTDQRNASISCDLAGNFAVSWQDDRNENSDVYAQRFLNNGNPIGDNFRVNESIANLYEYNADLAMDNAGNFMIAWDDQRNGFKGDIYAQSYLSDGTATGENTKVNDDEGSENQQWPSIAVDGSENFIIVWLDTRNDGDEVYAQRFTSEGATLGNNFKVNDDTSRYNLHWSPVVAADANGNFIIAWVDTEDGGLDRIRHHNLNDRDLIEGISDKKGTEPDV